MSEKLPLNPNAELFRWGPAPMRLFYNSEFDGIMINFPKTFPGEAWPDGLLISKGKMMVWVNEFPELREIGRRAFLKYILPIEERKKVFSGWENDLGKVNEWEKFVDSVSLFDLSDAEFKKLWTHMREVLMGFWTHALMPELTNYGVEKLLEEKLGEIIPDKVEVSAVMEVLTAPEAPSFYHVEECELYRSTDIKEHTRKYYWLRNSYDGTEILDTAFFQKRKKEITSDPQIAFDERLEALRKKREETIKAYHIPVDIVNMADAIARCVEWQDERKKNIWTYLHYKNLMLEEAVRRTRIPKDDLLNFGTTEILDFLEGNIPSKDTITDRHKGFVAVMQVLQETKMSGSKEAQKYWDLYVEEKISGTEKEIKGTVVSGASKPVKGRVRVLLNPKQHDDFNQGDVLVAPMTTPEYIFAMKKAVAVITDTGGLTSHAAVVSRELKIPCIVGTKIATKVLKDGDMVEVDAEKGVVKIIT